MGFKETKRRVVAALREGRFRHERSGVASGKNLLATGEVTVDEVVALLERCRGNQYSVRTHHFDAKITVHVCCPRHRKEEWYIKFYFLNEEDAGTLFMSVHKSVYRRRE
jgi:hypothetical protein